MESHADSVFSVVHFNGGGWRKYPDAGLARVREKQKTTPLKRSRDSRFLLPSLAS
jgi:hypothetical protein